MLLGVVVYRVRKFVLVMLMEKNVKMLVVIDVMELISRNVKKFMTMFILGVLKKDVLVHLALQKLLKAELVCLINILIMFMMFLLVYQK